MTIEKSLNDTALNLAIAGRLDTATAPQLEAELRSALNGVETLVLDFSALEYLSSAGLRVLLSTQKIMAGRGGMIVKNVNETVREVFDVTGFSDILTIE